MKRTLIILFSAVALNAAAQEKGVPFNGAIADIAGTPIKKAKIYTKSESVFTYSDKQGRFGLTDVKGTDTLHIKYKKTIYDIPIEGKKSVRIRLGDQLNTQAQEDEEIFNLGYSFVKKREYLNSGGRLTGEQLRREGYQTIMEAIKGRIAGLNVTTDMNGNMVSANIRGINSVYGSNTPLFLLNDMEVTSFDHINLSDVDYIEVQKDANIYGARGANGVIKVYTNNTSKK